MKKIINSIITFSIALIGFLGGLFWGIQSAWEWEPIILIAVSFLEIFGFLFNKFYSDEDEIKNLKQEQNVNVNVNLNGFTNDSNSTIKENTDNMTDRNLKIDFMKSKTHILFIDDDKNFNVVKILKDSGWKNTKTVIDIKSIDTPSIKETDIFFVDINGVGKLLNLENEGLDLALMLKQKYPNKKVIIYSANKNSNSFHKAWDICDFKLAKNALPYDFQSLVEGYSLEYYTE